MSINISAEVDVDESTADAANLSSTASSPVTIHEEDDNAHQNENNGLNNTATQNNNNENSDIAKSEIEKENTDYNNTETEAIPVSDDEEIASAESQQMDVPLQEIREELDETSIAREINHYIILNRVNFGEIDSLEEMWSYCDAISAAHSGLPDSLLKEAFLKVLDANYEQAKKKSWMRQHLDKLIKIWKREMLSDKSFSRPTKFVSTSVNYSPPRQHDINVHMGQQHKIDEETGKATSQSADHVKTTEDCAKLRRQRKQAAKRKRTLASIMGVGQMLEHARRKFATEEGELDIDEDEYGNFVIGGIELTFESWGQLNKIKNDGIVRSNIAPSKRWKRRQQNGTSISSIKQLGQLQDAPKPPNFQYETTQLVSMAEQYPTVGEVEMPNEKSDQIKMHKGNNKHNLIIEEKDEGEISDSDETTSSSSEESENGEQQKKKKLVKNVIQKQKQHHERAQQVQHHKQHDRKRAGKGEEKKQQQGASSAQNLQLLLKKCFDLRCRIVRKLNIQQKAMFMDLLKQSMAGTLQQNTQQQHQALSQLMGSFI